MRTADNPDTGAYTAEWVQFSHGELQAQWPGLVRGHRVVELGAAAGRNRELLPQIIGYVGLDLDEELLRRGADSGLDMRTVDLNDKSSIQEHSELFAGATTVLALDVLEHLLDPRGTLELVASMAGPGSRIVISVPNAVFVSARWNILRGRFPRRENGIFDRTHRAFFTRQTLEGELVAPHLPRTSCVILPTSFPIGGNRLGRLRLFGARSVGLVRRAAMKASLVWPGVFAFEWLIILDVGGPAAKCTSAPV